MIVGPLDRLACACHRFALRAAVVFMALAGNPCAGAEPDPPTKSAGCAHPPPEAPPEQIVAGGRSRQLILAILPDDDPAVPHDLVVAFHGRTSSVEQVRGDFELERHALKLTLFVYPQSLAAAPGTPWWPSPRDPIGCGHNWPLSQVSPAAGERREAATDDDDLSSPLRPKFRHRGQSIG